MTGAGELGRRSRSAEVVERCEARRLRPDFVGALSRPEMNPFLDYETMAVELRRWSLGRVVLDRDTMVLGRRRLARRPVALPETAYLQDPARIAALDWQGTRELRFRSPVTLCFDHWNTNFFHWIAHAVPVLGIVAEGPERRAPILLPEPLQDWQRETLELLGLPAAGQPRVAAGERLRLRTATYYDHVRGLADFALSPRTAATYARMVRSAGADRPTGRRIWVSRRQQANRRAPNDAELEAMLLSHGFELLHPETMTLSAQIRRFREAAFVVGFLGAGLSNIAWCAPGTIVYELVPSHHPNPCFAVMAQQNNLRYWADLLDSGVTQPSHETAFARPVELAPIERRIIELSALS